MSTPTLAITRTEFRLFTRQPGSAFWIVAFPPLLLGILGLVPSFREPDPGLGGARVVDLYVTVTILLSIIMAALQSMPPTVTAYREQRILLRYATTPVRPLSVLAAQFLVHAAAVVAGAVLVLVVGALAYDARPPGAPGPYLAVLALALVSTFAVGGLIAGTAATSKAAATIGGVVHLAMMFTAGVWFPVTAMPGTLRQVVGLTPLGAAARAMDEAAAGSWPGAGSVLVLLAWTAGATFLAARFFRWDQAGRS